MKLGCLNLLLGNLLPMNVHLLSFLFLSLNKLSILLEIVKDIKFRGFNGLKLLSFK